MADKGFKRFFRQSKDQLKRLRERIQHLKEVQKGKDDELDSIKAPKPEKEKEVVVHFSMLNIAQCTIVVLFLFAMANFVSEIGEILTLFFVALLFSAALNPSVNALEKRKIPRGVSVLIVFAVMITAIVFFVSKLVPLVAIQLVELAKNLGGLLSLDQLENAKYPFSKTIQPLLNDFLSNVDQETVINQLKESLEGIAQELQSFAGNAFSTVKALFNGVANFIMVLILTFFLVVDEKGVVNFFISLFPSKHAKYIIEKTEVIQHKVGYWLRGQIILMIVMFFVTWIGFTIIGVDFALTLAMIAGLAEIIPVLGPILAAIPALLVAFNESFFLVFWTLGFIAVIQQMEGSLLVPLIMRKAVGLSPIIVILAMLIGFKTLGVLGAIIAIPVTTALSIFVKDYAAKKK